MLVSLVLHQANLFTQSTWHLVSLNPPHGQEGAFETGYSWPADSSSCSLSALEFNKQDALLPSAEEEPLIMEESSLHARLIGIGLLAVAQLAVGAFFTESLFYRVNWCISLSCSLVFTIIGFMDLLDAAHAN